MSIKIAKNNRQLTISADQLTKYRELGYRQIDEAGSVISTGDPDDMEEIKESFRNLTTALETAQRKLSNCLEENKMLLVENERLDAKNTELLTQLAQEKPKAAKAPK